MITKTRGVVFRKMRYSETSMIADIYTEEHGLMSYIMGGVRSTKSRTSAGLFELMSIVEIVAYHSDRQKLHRIKEIKPAVLYQSIPFDVRKSAILMFMAELCAKTIKESEQNPTLFACIVNQLRILDELPTGFINRHLEFMVALAEELGFGIHAHLTDDASCFDMLTGNFVHTTPDHPYILLETHGLKQLLNKTAGISGTLVLTRIERNQLIDALLLYYKLHLEQMSDLQSHDILREIL